MRSFVAAAACVVIAACGLSTSGTQAIGGGQTTDSSDAANGGSSGNGSSGSTTTDAGGTDPGDAPVTCDAPPEGWGRVAYVGDRNTACPSGSTSADLIENPTARAGACGCSTSCSISQHQHCDTGDVKNYFDNSQNALCDSAGSFNFDNNPSDRCNDQHQTFSLGRHFKATPPAATGPSKCSIDSTTSKDAVVTTSVRTCAPSSPSACDVVKVGDCISAPGDVSCPSGPWQTRHLLASDFAVACADAQCGCSVTTKCQGTLVLSSKNDCNGGQTGSFAVDDKCYPAPNDSGYQYARYTGTIASETCAGTPPSAKVTLTNAQTVCCR